MLLIRFHHCIEGQPVNTALRARIESAANDVGESGGVLGFLD